MDLMCPYFQCPIVQWKPSIHLHARTVRVYKGTPAVVKGKRNSFRNHTDNMFMAVPVAMQETVGIIDTQDVWLACSVDIGKPISAHLVI